MSSEHLSNLSETTLPRLCQVALERVHELRHEAIRLTLDELDRPAAPRAAHVFDRIEAINKAVDLTDTRSLGSIRFAIDRLSNEIIDLKLARPLGVEAAA